MLVHVGQPQVAERIHNAWLRTIEEGIHTPDIYQDGVSQECVGTQAFTNAVIKRLGQQPQVLSPVTYARNIARLTVPSAVAKSTQERRLVGTDVFLYWDAADRNPNVLGANLSQVGNGQLALTMVTNRGLKVWPNGSPETFCTDHWRCRFESTVQGAPVTQQQVIDLLQQIDAHGFDIIKTEHLFTFDGKPGFSLGQGQ